MDHDPDPKRAAEIADQLAQLRELFAASPVPPMLHGIPCARPDAPVIPWVPTPYDVQLLRGFRISPGVTDEPR